MRTVRSVPALTVGAGVGAGAAAGAAAALAGGTVLVAALTALGALLLAAVVILAAWDLRRRMRRAQRAAVRRHRRAMEAARAQTARVRQRVARSEARNLAALDEISRALERSVALLRTGAGNDIAQVEAFVQLVKLADLQQAIPRTRGFPASPDALLILVDLLRRERPATYLEFGSGTSTIVAASAVRALGSRTRVVAVDHDADYAAATVDLVKHHGLQDIVEVRVAPLVPDALDSTRLWYDVAMLDDLQGIGMVFVDGPPGSTNEQARHPVMRFLQGRFAPRAVVVIDDADRDDERALVQQWTACPGVVSVTRHLTEKGLAVIEVAATT